MVLISPRMLLAWRPIFVSSSFYCLCQRAAQSEVADILNKCLICLTRKNVLKPGAYTVTINDIS